MIANTIIRSALRKLLVTYSGQEPTVNQYTDGLEGLNDLVHLLSANASLIYQDTREEITLASGEQNFTIGTTGDYVTAQPIQILNASISYGNHEYPLELIDNNVYERIEDKTTGSQPTMLYFRNTHPNSTIYFDCALNQQATLILTSMKQIIDFPDGITDISLPSYYESYFKHNLATYLAAEYGAANRVTPLMERMAEESKSAIIGRSVKIRVSTTDLCNYRYGYGGGSGDSNGGGGVTPAETFLFIPLGSESLITSGGLTFTVP